ncbi:DUF2306 domain-containing protein [Paenibacillus sp. MMS18-CY102]|uniref:DUF2306 domain-containing protein n=1 Tax=Paenibacillus sp. MMS18-CY102 TaxID=2682849 RepID=UPI001365776A|nr:DUF2306 domain-containing protein [Paenibacillus sp. MMS18-CY102]MWC29710.1 DUF2306 domain-containing protein [Paenibacillus sp. MMS18-CY102]
MNKQGSRGRAWGFGILAVLAVVVGLYALAFYGSPDGVKEQPFSMEKGSMPSLWYSVLWAHAVSAGVAIGIGWLQFVKRIRQRLPQFHRIIGYAYSVMLIIASFTGLYLAFYSDGGLSGHIGFSALSLMWLYTLYRALKSIIADRQPIAHGNWMTRNYALTCAAITLRIYTALAGALFGLDDTDDTFTVIAWLCWVPNLFVAEMIISRRIIARHR